MIGGRRATLAPRGACLSFSKNERPPDRRVPGGRSYEVVRDIYIHPRHAGDGLGLLADGTTWTTWNTTVEKVVGEIAPGRKLKVYTKLSPGRAFPVRVSTFDPPRRMVWTGGMPLRLFKGVRTYTLEPKDGGVEFSMTEAFSGLLAPLITRSIPDLQPAFVEFAAALKRRAESGPA